LFDESKQKEADIDDLPTLLAKDSNGNIVVNLPQPRSIPLLGDILIRVKHSGAFSNSLVCRISFNTAFTFSQNMKYTLKEVSPVSIRKDERISKDFGITLITEPFCKKCNSQTPISNF